MSCGCFDLNGTPQRVAQMLWLRGSSRAAPEAHCMPGTLNPDLYAFASRLSLSQPPADDVTSFGTLHGHNVYGINLTLVIITIVPRSKQSHGAYIHTVAPKLTIPMLCDA
jgi:hypothetical protein